MIDLSSAGLTQSRTVLSDAKRKLIEKYAHGEFSGAGEKFASLERRPPGEPVPLSRCQEQIWRHAVEGKKVASFYNESTTIHRRGELNKEALDHSFTEIIRRHDAWRTTFDVMNGRPVQIVHPPPARIELEHINLSTLPASSREADALRLASEDARAPFDLKEGPLVRALLITLDEQQHSLYITMHQSVTDGVSVYRILPSELTAYYTEFSGGPPAALPDLPLQYADFAFNERRATSEEALVDEMIYWRGQLSGGIPELQWPARHLTAQGSDYHGAIQAFSLPRQLCDRLTELSKHDGVTLFMTLLAGFVALLFSYTGQEDITTGTVAPAGRKRAEVQDLLGYFLNPIALRVNLSGNPTIAELLRRCHEVTAGALSHDNVPIESVRDALGPQGALSRSWPFMLAITLAPAVPALAPGWSQSVMDCDSGWAKWDLYLELSNRSQGMIGRAQYRTDLFSTRVISRLLRDFECILSSIVDKPEQRLSDLPRLEKN